MVPTLSIVTPAYNEASGIVPLIQSWITAIDRHGVGAEIVVCDDGSTDGTVEELETIADLRLRVVRLVVNNGPGAALREAIDRSCGEWVLVIDSDGQFDITDGLAMLNVALMDSVAVVGFRRKNDILIKRVGSRFSSWLANRAVKARFRDFNCAIKVLPGPWARSVTWRSLRFNYSAEHSAMLALHRLPFRQVPVSHAPRVSGVSASRVIRDGIDRLVFIAYLWSLRFLASKRAVSL